MNLLLAIWELSPKTKRRMLINRIKGMHDARKFRNELSALKKPVFTPYSKYK